MHAGRRGNRKIKRSTTRFASTLSHRGVQPSALTRYFGIKIQWVEMLLDDSKAARAASSDFVIPRGENSKVQLCQRDNANRGVLVRVDIRRDQYRGIEQNSRHVSVRPGIHQVAAHFLQILHKRRVGRSVP
jgi:hypothetical protein